MHTALGQSEPLGLLLGGALAVAVREALDGITHVLHRSEEHVAVGGDLFELGYPVVALDNHGIELLLELGVRERVLQRLALGAVCGVCVCYSIVLGVF